MNGPLKTSIIQTVKVMKNKGGLKCDNEMGGGVLGAILEQKKGVCG